MLVLGMLAIIPGMIAGSALTDAKQAPNVVTQVSFAYVIVAVGGTTWTNLEAVCWDSGFLRVPFYTY